ncbi:WD40-repeat-containing domain protein [Dipodascopsis uninucleata]
MLHKSLKDEILDANFKFSTRNCIRIRGKIARSPTCLAHSGRLLLYIDESNYDMKTWDLAVNRQHFTLSRRSDTISSIVISPDSSMITSSSFDGSVKLWDSRLDGIFIRRIEDNTLIVNIKWFSSREPSNLCWNPSGTMIIGVCDGHLSIWDAVTGEQRQIWSLHLEDARYRVFLAISSIKWIWNKIIFKSVDSAVNEYDTVLNQKWRFAPSGEIFDVKYLCSQLYYSTTKNRILSVDADNNVRFWDIE